MITRPTTQQLLDDCAREVRESIMPAVTDPALRIKLEMMEQIIASCAIRSGHEMAWMAEESDAMEAYCDDVVAAFPAAATDSVAPALARYRADRRGGLVLDDRIHDYDLAGRAFSAALQLAMRERHEALTARASDLVTSRSDREGVLRPNFYFPGRS